MRNQIPFDGVIAAEYPDRKFDLALDAWLAALTEQSKARFAKSYPNLRSETFEVMAGVKNLRIVACSGDGSSRSAFAFVNKETGDIYKAASWKKPAEGARGSIFKLDVAPLTLGALYR